MEQNIILPEIIKLKKTAEGVKNPLQHSKSYISSSQKPQGNNPFKPKLYKKKKLTSSMAVHMSMIKSINSPEFMQQKHQNPKIPKLIKKNSSKMSQNQSLTIKKPMTYSSSSSVIFSKIPIFQKVIEND